MLTTIGAVAFGTGLWLFFLRRYDRVEPESLRHLLQVAGLGGGASIVAAVFLNEGASDLLHLRPERVDEATAFWKLVVFFLFSGFNEEICKAVAAVYATRWFGDLDEPVDAMIYAMTVALGFAAVESVLYASHYGNEVLLMRFLWPVPAHMAYAAIWGFGLAKARFTYPSRNRAAVMWPSVAAAGLLHAAANFGLVWQQNYSALLSLAVLMGLAFLAHQRLLRLVAESPYLEPGECPVCRNLNSPRAVHCFYCGEPLQETVMFRTCPSGRHRVPAHLKECPECGIPMRLGNPHVPTHRT